MVAVHIELGTVQDKNWGRCTIRQYRDNLYFVKI